MKQFCIAALFAAGSVLAQEKMPAHVFSPDSFWYRPIPNVAEFLRQKKAYYGTVSINTREYASPVYVVGSNAPTVQVTEWDCQNKKFKDPRLAEQWKAVPIPSYAEPADGTDAEMTVYQPSSDTVWEFWQARKTNGQWQACWGGQLTHASESNGIFPNNYGTTATSLPFLGGQIGVEELRRGEINHALGIALVDLENWDIRSWPATRSDGWNPKKVPNRIPEGLRFRLDPSVDVDKLDMPRAGKIIAKAAQKHGFVVWDKAGAITLRAENPKAYTLLGKPDPYPALFEGKEAWAILQNFPWDKLQFLPMDYGKP
jgi:hypothetical protein